MNAAQTTTQAVPYSQEAEEALIGSLLINPSAWYTVSSFLKADDFFLLRHNYIWIAIAAVMERDDQLDYLTVVEQLKAQGRLDAIGGDVYLISLFRNTPTSVHAELYGRVIQRAAMRRKLMQASDAIKGLALNEQLTTEAITLEAITTLDKALEQHTQSNIQPMMDIFAEYARALDDPFDIPAAGVPTGYEPLDAIMKGMHREDLTIWAGRPGMGKTACLTGVALNAAKAGANVAYIPLEMPKSQIRDRMLSQETALPLPVVRFRRNDDGSELTRQQIDLLKSATERLARLKGQIFIDDTPALDVVTLKAKLRRLHYQHGIDLVIIDHLGELSAPGQFKSGYEETNFKIEYIKDQIARDSQMRVPVQLAVQLNRSLENRKDKRPMQSDLRESGRIEEKADNIIFIYRDIVYNEFCEFPNQAELIIAKHRNGSTATVDLYFEKSCAKFMNGTPRNINLDDL